VQFARAAESDEDVQKVLDEVVLVKVHNKRGDDVNLIKSYKVRGYPTFVLSSKEGETLYRWWGYTKEAFLNEIKQGLADPTTIVEKNERYNKNPDAKTAKALAAYHYTTGDMENAQRFYTDAAKYDPENDYAYELYRVYRSGYGNEIYTKEQFLSATDKALNSKYVDTLSKLRIYDQMSAAIIRFRSDADVLDYIRRGYDYSQKVSDDDLQRYKTRLEIMYVLYIEKDQYKAVSLKKGTFEDGWGDNPSDLNSFSWWCFQHQVNLEEAEKLAGRAVKLAEPGNGRGNILDTLAEIVNLRGRPSEAVSLMEEAVKGEPDNEYFQKQLEKFRNLSGEMTAK
jgi:tetratricopeptide (TPR) repeat protein